MEMSDSAPSIRPAGLDQRKQRSSASFGEKAFERAVSSRHGLERLSLSAWTNQETSAFVLREPLFDYFRFPLERANLSHGFSTIRNCNCLSSTHTIMAGQNA